MFVWIFHQFGGVQVTAGRQDGFGFVEVEINLIQATLGDRGSTVFKVLCYKSEGRCFDLSWCHWNFSLTSNPSDRTMVPVSTQPLTEMITGSISWG